MKKITTVLALMLTAITLFAASAKLDWCPNPEANIVGYKIHYVGTNKVAGWKPSVFSTTNCPAVVLTNGANWVRNYNTVFISTGLVTTATISNLVVGKTYYFAVTAFDSNSLDSDFSAEIEATITNLPPSQPQNFKILEQR